MLQFLRTNSENPQFIELVQQLDADLAERDGEEHSFYAQFNNIDQLKYVIIALENNEVISCGAVKPYDDERMELKRMYTLPEQRGRGVASGVLKALEKWAKELSYKKCILETGIKQPEAIKLYTKNGYQLIANYGQYVTVENSSCFEKALK